MPAAVGRRHTDGWGSRLTKAPDLIRVSLLECAHGLFNNTRWVMKMGVWGVEG